MISAGSLVQTAPTLNASHFEQSQDHNHKPFACCIYVELSSHVWQTP